MQNYVCLGFCLGLSFCAPTNSELTQEQLPLFSLIPNETSGIFFNEHYQEIPDTDPTYIKGGTSVVILDVNQDGLQDVFFSNFDTGKSCGLYLNEGNFRFKDITESSGFGRNNSLFKVWSSTVVDINTDGFPDLYLSKSGSLFDRQQSDDIPDYGRNLLFVNQGDLTFKESAAEYNLDLNGNTHAAQFFDFDNDNDLDLYLLNSTLFDGNLFDFNFYKQELTELRNSDQLLENRNGKFFDISKKVGLKPERNFGHGASVADINGDGYSDLFISSDFHGKDQLLINEHGNKLIDQTDKYFSKTSLASMGSDFGDINNDGWQDLIVVDMLPESHDRQKNTLVPITEELIALQKQFGPAQYVRNTMHLNRNGKSFDEIGFAFRIHATDWSWAPLIEDFDLNGFQDILVTNGMTRDYTNMDFIRQNYGNIVQEYDPSNSAQLPTKRLELLPKFRSRNYLFLNDDDFNLKDQTLKAGLNQVVHSRGAAYADLDNDGDLDLILNNLDTVPFIYKNQTKESSRVASLSVKLKGPKTNPDGYGNKVSFHQGMSVQYRTISNSRGFRSCSEPIATFGVKENLKIDSVVVLWLDQKREVIKEPLPNSKLVVDYSNATTIKTSIAKDQSQIWIAQDSSGIDFLHLESSFSDFKRDRLLHKKLSRPGPGYAAADVNGDGTKDLFIGNSSGQESTMFISNTNGGFQQSTSQPWHSFTQSEDNVAHFFDFEGDGDQDLFLGSGSNEFDNQDDRMIDRIFINDSRGNFKYALNLLPEMRSNTSAVASADYDKDGDIDLFIGSSSKSGNYPISEQSRLLRNEGKRFVFSQKEDASDSLNSIYLTQSVQWADLNQDDWTDLVVVGHWTDPKIYRNNKGKLSLWKIPGINQNTLSGWWNYVDLYDIDSDGDLDLLLGNQGINSFFTASHEEPVIIYHIDLDQNGVYEPILFSSILGVTAPFVDRDRFCQQMPAMNNKYYTFEKFAKATLDSLITFQQKESELHYHASELRSGWLENRRKEPWQFHPFPAIAQFSPINHIVAFDLDDDGNDELICSGNSNTEHFTFGNPDASYITVLDIHDGKLKYNAELTNQLYHKGVFKAAVPFEFESHQSLVLLRNSDQPIVLQHNR